MLQLTENTLADLEYDEIIKRITSFCIHEAAKEGISNLEPSNSYEFVSEQLNLTSEYLGCIESGNNIGLSEYFYDEDYLNLLEIENYHLKTDYFLGIRSNLHQIKAIQKSISVVEEIYPVLFTYIQKLPFENEILKRINEVFKQEGEIKNNASLELGNIRLQINRTKNKIDDNFNAALRTNREFLSDIKESVVDERRVLAVIAGFRKRVTGRLLGTSKTGSISFVEPNSVSLLNSNLEQLKEDEKREITKILIELTAYISPYSDYLSDLQDLLKNLDCLRAKSLYARKLNAIKPLLVSEPVWDIRKAYHPLLLEKNIANGKTTFPHDILLNPKQRIIMISGPNAGGKSITLKTVGLLQLMLQSGILIPVKEGSKMSLFNKIFTDIGDHQSIENRLSTYSYRLKQMSYFLRKADEHTLLLVDEFGTGSDPLLGGALAEVLLEDFYDKKVFAIFTSHYTNLKICVEGLENAINANLLFDQKTLEATYQLVLGQAGSSFTFEVAEKNRIPYNVINRAKKKIERDKIKYDQTLSTLQSKKMQLQKTQDAVNEDFQNQSDSTENIKHLEDKIQKKLVDFQLLFDENQKELSTGKKMMTIATSYAKNPNKKKSIEQFMKWLEMESVGINAKIKSGKAKSLKTINKQLEADKETHAEAILDKIASIGDAKIEKVEKLKAKLLFGDRIRIKGSTSVGTVDRVEKHKVVINYGKFTTTVAFEEVEIV